MVRNAFPIYLALLELFSPSSWPAMLGSFTASLLKMSTNIPSACSPVSSKSSCWYQSFRISRISCQSDSLFPVGPVLRRWAPPTVGWSFRATSLIFKGSSSPLVTLWWRMSQTSLPMISFTFSSLSPMFDVLRGLWLTVDASNPYLILGLKAYQTAKNILLQHDLLSMRCSDFTMCWNMNVYYP